VTTDADSQPHSSHQTARNRLAGIPGTPRLSLTISEAQFQQTVIDTARLFGWRCAHFRPARTRSGAWATPMQGDVGFPDLVLCRDGVVILAELKRHGGRPTPAQRAWLAAAGEHGRLWSPGMWDRILDELRPARTTNGAN
jgi:hypothetical protein